MRRFIMTRAIPLFAMMTVIGYFAMTSSAIPGDPAKKQATAKAGALMTHALGKATIHPDLVTTHRRAAVAHKPLEMVDPKTGKKVTADTMITLSTGKTVKAGEYYTKLEAIHKEFCKLGFSFHDKNGGKVLLHETKIDTKTLDTHSTKLRSVHAAFNAKAMKAVPTHAEMGKQIAAAATNDANRVKALRDAITPQGNPAANANPNNQQAKTSSTTKAWNYSLGNRKIVGAYLNGKLEVRGSKDEVAVLADAAAGGYLINHDINIIKANGSVKAPLTGTSNASLHVYLLGQHVINLNKSVTTNYQVSDTKSHGIDVHADWNFPIGPIPMTVHVGARGNVGVRYTVAVRPAHASFQVTPFIDVKVYVKAGVTIFVASGGAAGEMTLIKDELRVGAELDLKIDPSRGPILTEHFYAQNNMNMLAGRVYAWVRVNYIFSSHEWQYNLWNWKGLQANGYLFNITSSQTLIPNYQAVAAQ